MGFTMGVYYPGRKRLLRLYIFSLCISIATWLIVARKRSPKSIEYSVWRSYGAGKEARRGYCFLVSTR